MPLAMVTGPAATPSYTWITTGNLNEPLLLTNGAGQVTASTTRDPWGNPILLAGTEPLDLGYPGQWRDPATGLFQNWHRDYDPTLGRYTEADPLGLGGGSNVFAYVGGDPVNMVDPDGLKSAEALAVEVTLRRVIPKAAVRVISRPSRKIPVIGQALLVGDILGSTLAIAKFCYDHSGDDVDEDGPCEFRKREDELECNQWNIFGGRDGYTRQEGLAVCLRTVMIRYGECRSRGMNPSRTTTPLFLPTNRRSGPDRRRPRGK
jgi:RHS repeat-associated protein